MSPGPDIALLQDPRLPQVLRKAMRKNGVPDFMEEQIKSLVSGQTDPRSVMCCHSGCKPCAQDLLRCAAAVITRLHQKKKRFLFW